VRLHDTCTAVKPGSLLLTWPAPACQLTRYTQPRLQSLLGSLTPSQGQAIPAVTCQATAPLVQGQH